MSKSVSCPLALMFLLVLTLSTAVAQEQGTAEVSGVVLDASGKPVAGHPLSLVTAQWGKVVMHPTEDDGTFVVSGLPAGDFELLVFSPSGSRDVPIAAKKFTLADGQKQRIEIRVGSDNPGGATGSPAGTSLGAIGVDRMTVLTAALVLAAGLVIFFVMRSRRRTVE